MKRIVSIMIILVLCLGMYVPAAAKEGIPMTAGLTSTVSQRCYIDTEGNLWMWGENEYGQCGQDPSTKWIDKPIMVMSNVVSVCRRKEAVIVLKADGTAWTWGYDFNHGAEVRRKYSNSKMLYNYVKGPEPYKVADNVAATVRAMQNSMGRSRVESLVNILDGKAEALEFVIREPSEATDKPLQQMKLKKNLLVACIMRRKEIIYPRGGDEIKVGDKVVIVTGHQGLNDITDILQSTGGRES